MSETPQNLDPTPESSASTPLWPILVCVQDALRGLKYGQVTLIVQDGCVVQIDRLERKRLAKAAR